YYHIDHFGVLPHQSLWGTTISITLGYYHIDHFGILPHRSLWGTTTSFTFFWLGAGGLAVLISCFSIQWVICFASDAILDATLDIMLNA
ncbi:9342_t:CDS:2, partial [Dentiscutata heterogama]